MKNNDNIEKIKIYLYEFACKNIQDTLKKIKFIALIIQVTTYFLTYDNF